MSQKWPKVFADLSEEQLQISNDFMEYWHKQLSKDKKYTFIEKFNHGYPIKRSTVDFVRTLEIGSGLGTHLTYENLSTLQKANYHALEIRENMAAKIHERFPEVQVTVGDCQQTLPYSEHYFDRIIAIHVLEHLPNLPAAIKEMHRVCNKQKGELIIVIPCEGGKLYSLGRKLSAQRLFEKRYNQSYQWFIEREHVNKSCEIIEELEHFFYIKHTQYFPWLIPSVNLNLCIGVTLIPKKI